MDQHRGRKIPEPSRLDGTDGTGGLCHTMDHEFLFRLYATAGISGPESLRHRGKPTGSSRNPASGGDAANRERRIPAIHFAGGDFIFVTNEIGMGGVSTNEVQRRFTDLLGWTNQFVASQADEVYLMVSGIPMKIK